MQLKILTKNSQKLVSGKWETETDFYIKMPFCWFTHEVLGASLFCENKNCRLMFSVGEFCNIWKINPTFLSFFSLRLYNGEPVWQTGGVEWCGCLSGRKFLMKDAFKFHHGKCRIKWFCFCCVWGLKVRVIYCIRLLPQFWPVLFKISLS